LTQFVSAIDKIAKRTTGHSQKVVRNVSRGLASDIFRTRTSCLEAYLPHLEAEWKAGCRNGSELWRNRELQVSAAASASSGNGRRGAGVVR
jgi:hypothetical protein